MSGVVVMGAGFVGSAIARRFDGRAEVVVLDLPTNPGLFDRDDHARDTVLDAMASVTATAVVNACGLLRGTPEELWEANARWPAWLARTLLGSSARLVHIGSAAEYGDPGTAEPIPETRDPEPRGDYAESKAAGSRALCEARADGLDASVARVFNLVGPSLSPVSPLYQFLSDVTALPASGGRIELWWPDTVRDYVLLEDLGEAIVRLALAETSVDVVNVCSGVGISFGDIALAMGRAQGKHVEIRSLERPGIPAVVGDPTRLGTLTGFRPTTTADLIAAHATLAPDV